MIKIILRKIGKIQISMIFLYFHFPPSLGWRLLLDLAAQETRLPLGLVALHLRDLVLRWGTVEPLRPRTIINGHIRLAAQVGSQGNVTRCDAFTARDRQRL